MKSMLRLRSCASSMMMALYLRSSLSRWISASRMPSVMSLTLVDAADLAGEADLEADFLADLDAEFLRDALGHGAGREPARLGVADQPVLAQAELEAHLGDLGGLTRAGLAGDDGHLVGRDGGHQIFAALGDRQLGGVGNMQCHGWRQSTGADCPLGGDGGCAVLLSGPAAAAGLFRCCFRPGAW